MSLDLEELARRAKDVEPGWDDLREQRVLDSIRNAPREAPEAPPRRLGLVVAAAVGLLAVGGALWAAGVLEPAADVAERPSAEDAVEATDVAPEAERSEMVLADGSTVTLDPDARVRLTEQGSDRVVLEQERGRATYAVSRVPSRSFEVHTPAAIVRVRGTVFVVEVGAEATTVEVSEGRVEVEARAGEGRRSLLGAGDAVSVATRSEVGSRSTESESAVGGRRSESESEVGGRRSASESAIGRRPSESESAVGSRSSESGSAPESADALLARADDARLAGDSPQAAEALERFLDRYATDARAASAAFTLGRVQNRRGRHGSAAEAFALCRQLAPSGPLAEDALAQEALAWSASGDDVRAGVAAARYLAAHPEGLHRSRLERLQGER